MNLKQLIEDPKLTKRIVLLITYTVLLIFALFNLDKLFSFFLSIFSLASPFFIGIAIAFVVNVILKFYEEKVFAFLNKKDLKLWKKCRRAVCVVLSFLTLIVILGAIILFVVPELVSSLEVLIRNAPTYISRLSNEIIRLLEKYNVTQDQINSLSIDWTSLLSKATEVTSNFMGSLFNICLLYTSAAIRSKRVPLHCWYWGPMQGPGCCGRSGY